MIKEVEKPWDNDIGCPSCVHTAKEHSKAKDDERGMLCPKCHTLYSLLPKYSIAERNFNDTLCCMTRALLSNVTSQSQYRKVMSGIIAAKYSDCTGYVMNDWHSTYSQEDMRELQSMLSSKGFYSILDGKQFIVYFAKYNDQPHFNLLGTKPLHKAFHVYE